MFQKLKGRIRHRRQREKEGGALWFSHPPNDHHRAGPGGSEESRTPFQSPAWVVGVTGAESTTPCLLDVLAGTWGRAEQLRRELALRWGDGVAGYSSACSATMLALSFVWRTLLLVE